MLNFSYFIQNAFKKETTVIIPREQWENKIIPGISLFRV